MASFFTDLTTTAIAQSLDASAMRHRVIADNIANVETPGFKRSEVSFESKLKSALESLNSDMAMRTIEGMEPDVEQDTQSPARADGNNVSIDREMADLTKNSLEYETLTRLMTMKGSMIQTVLTEGRR